MKILTLTSKSPIIISLMTVLWVSPAMADEFVCRGNFRARTFDNVRVPQNATCKLIGTRIKGTIKVENNARLTARKIIVIGNVQAENARQVNILERSRVGGSVQVKQGGGANVYDSFVDSDIQYDTNRAYVRALRNDVGGNVQVVSNTRGAAIRRNVIDGNLQCKQNFPAPIGGNNVVGGSKEDQCSRL
jgi:hypothetical protein